MKLAALIFLFPLTLALADSTDGYQPDRADCTVTTAFEHTAYNGRCSRNEVMTGIQGGDPLLIRCSRLEVRCSKPGAEVPATAEDPSHN